MRETFTFNFFLKKKLLTLSKGGSVGQEEHLPEQDFFVVVLVFSCAYLTATLPALRVVGGSGARPSGSTPWTSHQFIFGTNGKTDNYILTYGQIRVPNSPEEHVL